jgi:hypothetical protein
LFNLLRIDKSQIVFYAKYETSVGPHCPGRAVASIDIFNYFSFLVRFLIMKEFNSRVVNEVLPNFLVLGAQKAGTT